MRSLRKKLRVVLQKKTLRVLGSMLAVAGLTAACSGAGSQSSLYVPAPSPTPDSSPDAVGSARSGVVGRGALRSNRRQVSGKQALAASLKALGDRNYGNVLIFSTYAIRRGDLDNRLLSIAYTTRAAAYYNNRQYRRAKSDLGAAILADGTNYIALEGRGQLHVEQRQYGLALADYSSSIRIKPRFHNYYLRGLLLLHMQRAGAANRDFSQAIARRPYDAKAYFARGLSYHMIGRRRSAAADYRYVLQINPNHKGARSALRLLARGRGPAPRRPTVPFEPPKVKI